MENIIGHIVDNTEFEVIPGKQYHLRVVGAKIKKGNEAPKKGQKKGNRDYILVTSRSTEDNAMPAVRSNLATFWRLDQFLNAVSLKKMPAPEKLIGKEFDATLVSHPFNGVNFVDVNQYI